MMSYTLIVSLKILYVTTLLSFFTYYFGLQSYIMYSERRVMFTDEMVDFRQDKPPAILIAHTPLKPKNVHVIGSCIKENKQEEKGYAQAVKCIDKNLKNETEISVDSNREADDNNETETIFWGETFTKKIGLTRRSISGCVLPASR